MDVVTPHLPVDVAMRAEVDPRLDGGLAAALDEIAHHVPLAAAPRGLLQAVRIEVALPLQEAVEMRRREHRVLGPRGLGRLDPLVGVQLGRVVQLRVQPLADGVVAGEALGGDGQVERVEQPDLAVLPRHLRSRRHRQSRRIPGRRLSHRANPRRPECRRACRQTEELTPRALHRPFLSSDIEGGNAIEAVGQEYHGANCNRNPSRPQATAAGIGLRKPARRGAPSEPVHHSDLPPPIKGRAPPRARIRRPGHSSSIQTVIAPGSRLAQA